MTDKPADVLKALLEKKRRAVRSKSAGAPANALTNKQNRWQRFNRYVWDRKP